MGVHIRSKQTLYNKGCQKTAIVTTIMAILTAIITGILGNRADALFIWLLGQIIVSMRTNYWPWLIASPIVLCCLVMTFIMWRYTVALKRLLKSSNYMLILDTLLLRLLAAWIPPLATAHDKQTKQILREVLSDMMIEFKGHVKRAAILLPDAQREYLKCWVHYEMSPESITNMKFYIGSDQQKFLAEGGIAGQAFSTGEIIVAHMGLMNNQWVCEDYSNHYIKFRGLRHFPPYESFINIPITRMDTNLSGANTIGVICLDSPYRDIFDSDEVKATLRLFAQRVAAVILICNILPNA